MYRRHQLLPLGVSFGPLLQEYRLPPEVNCPSTRKATLRIIGIPQGCVSCLQPNGW